MATGIVRGEKLGRDSLSGASVGREQHPLPDDSAAVGLAFDRKLSEEQILTPSSPRRALLRYAKGCFRSARKLSPNALLLCDNFCGMKSLLSEYAGSVSLIYADPPFQTGMEFQSRQLEHAYKDLLAPAPYIEFMRRRLFLMRELLAENGSIYVHIGHQMVCHLKVVMDEVFGPAQFINLIVRRKCSSKNYTKKQYPNLHDYVLYYSKTKNYKFHQPRLSPSQEWIEREYPKIDPASGRRFKLVPIHAPGTRRGDCGKPWRGTKPPPGKHWQLRPSTLDELDARGDIHWSRNGNPRRKVWLEPNKTTPRTDYWEDFRDAHHQSIKVTGYPTEKNLHMLKAIVASGTDEGDLVLDPFCGSGTSLHAADELGRKWIGIDDSFAAFEALFRRFRDGVQPMGDFVSGSARRASRQGGDRSRGVAYNVYCDERFLTGFGQELKALLAASGK